MLLQQVVSRGSNWLQAVCAWASRFRLAVPEWSCIAVPFDSKLVRTGGGRDVAHASATREDKPS